MTATIVVLPERLRRAAVAARALDARLLGLRGDLGATVANLDGVFGDGEARASFAALWSCWSATAERLAAAVEDLAAALDAAADGYERADGAGERAPGMGGADATAR